MSSDIKLETSGSDMENYPARSESKSGSRSTSPVPLASCDESVNGMLSTSPGTVTKDKSESGSSSESEIESSYSRSSESSGPLFGRKKLKRNSTPKIEKNELKNEAPTARKWEIFGEVSSSSGSGSDDEIKREPKHENDDNEEVRDSNSDNEANVQDNENVEVSDGEAEAVVHNMETELPRTCIRKDLGHTQYFVKFPNFLSLDKRPFNADTYEDELYEEDEMDVEGRARIKLKVENTIRWRERFNEKGVFVKESNARFVRWSDGSQTLHLGKEIFNVSVDKLKDEFSHVYVRQSGILNAQCVLNSKLTFRPHSTESSTHRKMTMSLAERSAKMQRVKLLPIIGADPEANRQELLKKEGEKLRATTAREIKQRRVRERAYSRSLSTGYLDDNNSEDEDDISIAAIKNKYKKQAYKAKTPSLTSTESDDSDIELKRKLQRAKRLVDSDEDDELNDSPKSEVETKIDLAADVKVDEENNSD